MGDNHEKLKNDINPDSPRNRVECNGVLESRRHHLQDHGLLQVNEKFHPQKIFLFVLASALFLPGR